MSGEQKAWVAKRVEQRAKKQKDELKSLIAMKEEKLPGGKKTESSTSTDKNNEVDKKPKYTSAQDFMDTHFPSFESSENFETQGVLRHHQLNECQQVHQALLKKYPNQSMKNIELALVTPQDRALPLCLENLREPLEGLMENPLPQEEWRVYPKQKEVKEKKKKKKSGKAKE